MKFYYSILLAAALFADAGALLAAAPSSAARPNILFIYTDDQSYEALSVVQKELGEKCRFAGDEVKYNAAAARVMQKYGVLLDDLYATTKDFEPKMFRAPADVHYTPQGYKILAAQVVAQVAAALKDGGRIGGSLDEKPRRQTNKSP